MTISVVAKDNQTGALTFLLPMRYTSADIIIRGLELVREDLHKEMKAYQDADGNIDDQGNYNLAQNQYTEAGKLLNLFTDAR